MEPTTATSIWTIVIGITLGVGSGFILVWIAFKMTPYVQSFLFKDPQNEDKGAEILKDKDQNP